MAPVIFLAAGAQRPVRPPVVGGLPARQVREPELRALDFGFAVPNRTAAKSFWIRNRGDAPLTVQGVRLPQNSFGSATIFPATLQPGAEMEVACGFTAPPVAGMTVLGTFQIGSDDPLRPTADLAVRGKAAGASLIRIAPSGVPTMSESLDLGIVAPSHSAAITFRSDGTEGVKLMSINLTPNSGFSIGGLPQAMPAELAPLAELTLTVTLAAMPGRYRAQLQINHGLGILTVELDGTVN